MPSHNLPEYQTVFPEGAVTVLLDWLRGSPAVDLPCLVRAGYFVLGYALGQLLPDQHTELAVKCSATGVPASSDILAKQELTDVLEQVVKCHKSVHSTVAVGENAQINWLPIVMTVLQLIQQFLKK